MSSKDETVRVAIRCRPMNANEIADNCERVVDVDTRLGQVMVRKPQTPPPGRIFTFDQVYDWDVKQTDVYATTAMPIVESVLQGYNGTIFAYGQTGTGKTHTMEGKPENEGIIPQSFRHVFDTIGASPDKQFLVRASFLELYNEDIRDLLSKHPRNKLDLKEAVDGFYVKDLNTIVVQTVSELVHVLNKGKKNRTTGETKMNQDSSRSHSIFTITIESSELGDDGQQHIRVGKLNMVDLAGSERQSKTGATGERLIEATKINMSLTNLGRVISHLVRGKTQAHIPYRDSKLTKMLQDSLGGNTKTVMVANIGPADYNYDETVNTLRYAESAKKIKNKPRINEDPKDAMIREYKEEIERLRAQLEQAGGKGVPIGAGPSVGPSAEELKEIEEKHKSEMEKKAKELKDMADAEKAKLLESMSEKEKAAQAEREKLQREAAKRKEQAERERKKKEELLHRLHSMEDKLVQGGGAEKVLQEVEVQRHKLEELELKRKEEEAARKTAQELHEREKQELAELMEEKEETFKSVQDELESKTKKLKKLFKQYKAQMEENNLLQLENQEIQEVFWREKEELLDTVRELQAQLKLKHLIVMNFIPLEEVEKLERRAHWDEEREDWAISRIALAGNNVRQTRPKAHPNARVPTSDYAQYASHMDPDNPRYRGENIINVGLDMPERTTQDYEGPSINPHVQAVLDAAFKEEEDMTFAAAENLPNVYYSYADTQPMYDYGGEPQPQPSRPRTAARKSRPGGSKARPSTARKRKEKGERDRTKKDDRREMEPELGLDPEEQFPIARGLMAGE
eukprot:Rmarinus@m.27920